MTPTPKLITIEAGPHSLRAALNDTDTAGKIFALLPLEAVGNTWGDEIYFGVGIDAALEDGQAIVQVGDLGFWPTGNVFCIFYGQTPASHGQEIRPASAVTIVGRVLDDATVLRGSADGIPIRLHKAE